MPKFDNLCITQDLLTLPFLQIIVAYCLPEHSHFRFFFMAYAQIPALSFLAIPEWVDAEGKSPHIYHT